MLKTASVTIGCLAILLAPAEALNMSGETSYSNFRDSDGMQIDAWQELAEMQVSQFYRLMGSYRRAHYSGDAAATYGNTYTVGGSWEKGEQSFDLSYGYRNFTRAKSASTYQLNVQTPLLFLRNVRIASGYDYWETGKAIEANIRAYTNSLTMEQPLAQRWVWTSFYQHRDFTDGNKRNDIEEAILFRFLKDNPEGRIGYGFVDDDTRFSTPIYWSPRDLRIHELKIFFLGKMFGRLGYNLAYAPGYALEKGEHNRIAHAADITLTYKLNGPFELFITCELSRDPTYRSSLWEGGIRCRF